MAKKILISVTLIVALGAGVVFVVERSSARAWRDYLAELRAAGEPLTFAEIAAEREAVPDGQRTVAEVVTRVAASIKATEGPPERGLLGDRDGPPIDLVAGIPPAAITLTRDFLAPYQGALDELSSIEGLPAGRFTISYEGPALQVMNRFSESCPPLRPILKRLYLAAILDLAAGEVDTAATRIPIMLDVVSPLADEPALLAHLVRISGIAMSATLLEQTLSAGRLDEAVLLNLDQDFASCLDTLSLQWALRGERILFIASLDEAHPGAVGRAAGGRGPLARIFSLAQYGDQRQGSEMLGWLIAAGDDPAKLRAALQGIEQYEANAPRSHFFTPLILASMPRAVESHLQAMAELRAARIALAAERYRLENAQLPDQLDDLVPEFFAVLPGDPFADAPMRGARNSDGLVIYSIGQDRKDDGGSVQPLDDQTRSRDIGLRLPNV